MHVRAVLLNLLVVTSLAAETVRPVPPPPKTELTADERGEIENGVVRLGQQIDRLRRSFAASPERLARLADVEIYFNAVRYPLTYHEQIDFKPAREAIRDGLARAAELANGRTPWLLASGPRGYVSKIDGSVQPYVVLVPDSYHPGEAKKYRLDLIEHGRDEGLTELRMIRTKTDHAVGDAAEKFSVLLYGRYCNANKFAGEIDLLEALDDVQSQYPIDDDRVLNIGFSMGGAACWQFATHYSDLFAAASPGAGFAETPEFLQLSPADIAATPWYQRKLWHLYDCTDYAVNLFNVPTVAYSGEIDAQKQSADVMEKSMTVDGLTLERIIGPHTAHAYEKHAKTELDKRLDQLLEQGRQWYAPHVRLATYTLRYNRMKWVTVEAMNQEWERAEVDARVDGHAVKVKTKNVSRLTLSFGGGGSPVQAGDAVNIDIDGAVSQLKSDANGRWVGSFEKSTTGWVVAPIGGRSGSGLRKRHGLQGPIDDAFLDRFIIVKPTGRAANPKVGAWADAECAHAIDHWRKQFRGEARVTTDADVTDADIAGSNLVLFGDASSNTVLAKIAARLPIQWNQARIAVGPKTYPSDHDALVMIYPNPLNPSRYVVLNSGFTFREFDYLNNARQVPKLPDYAVVDVDSPVTVYAPGRVVDAGFFQEQWQLPNDGGHEPGVMPTSRTAF